MIADGLGLPVTQVRPAYEDPLARLANAVRMPAGEPLSAVAAVKATWRGLAVEATAYARNGKTLDIPFASVSAGAGGATVLGARIGDDYTGDAIARISPALATVLKIEDLPSEILAMAHAGHHGEVAAFAALGETTVRAGGVVDLEKLSGRAVAVANDPRYGAAVVALDGDADHARGMIAGETVQQGQLVRTLVAVTGSRSGGWLTLGAASDAGFANTVATVTRTGDAFELASATLNVHGKRIDSATPDGTHARASGLDVKVTARGPLWPQPKLRVDGHITYIHNRALVPDGDDSSFTGYLAERPEMLATLTARYDLPFGLQPMVELVSTGQAFSPTDDGFVPLGPSTVINARLAWRTILPITRSSAAEVYIRVDNITDEVVLPQIGLPAAGREIQGGVKVTL